LDASIGNAGPMHPMQEQMRPMTDAAQPSSPSTFRKAAGVVHQPHLPKSPTKKSGAPIDQVMRDLLGKPLATSRHITYPNGVTIDISEFVASLMSVVSANAKHRTAMVRSIESGSFLRHAYDHFATCDKNGSGFLTWNNCEIRDFIVDIFKGYGLTPPEETQIYDVYIKFDRERCMYLGERECLCIVDVLFRSTFIVEFPESLGSEFPLDREADTFIGVDLGRRRQGDASDGDCWDIPSEGVSLCVDACSPIKALHNGDGFSIQRSPIQQRHINGHNTESRTDENGAVSRSKPTHPSDSSLAQGQGLTAAAVAAAAAAAATVTAVGAHEVGRANNTTLAEARLETERLRQELAELRELEASLASKALPTSTTTAVKSERLPQEFAELAEVQGPLANRALPNSTMTAVKKSDLDSADRSHPMSSSASFQASLFPANPGTTAASTGNQEVMRHPAGVADSVLLTWAAGEKKADSVLLWTAEAQAANSRMEQELESLRAVAERQRGEVRLLNSVKAMVGERSGTGKEAEGQPPPEDESFERRLRLLQQRERKTELERASLLERERALRDQELQMALKHERETVRSLVKEGIFDQREHQSAQSGLPYKDDTARKPPSISNTHSASSSVKASDAQPSLPMTTEPEAEAETGVSDEIRASGDDGRASQEVNDKEGVFAENSRLRQELQNLRQLAEWQKGEFDMASAYRPK